MKVTRSDFLSKGTRCAADLYLPENASRPPLVIMAHGVAAHRDFRLPAFAERFAARGLAVLLFDYRNFGDSGGEPRNLVSPWRQLSDWQAAIGHGRSLAEIDGTRMALWGSSFGGGHVLITAARTPNITAVVAQVPFVDGLASVFLHGPGYLVRSVFHGLRDGLRQLTGQRPFCIPVVADPAGFALMNSPDSRPGYLALVPRDSTWQNECPARVLLSGPFYRPTWYAGKIRAKVLIVYAAKDSLIPPRMTERTIRKIENAVAVSLPVGHFDVYVGEAFERAVGLEVDFLVEQLGVVYPEG